MRGPRDAALRAARARMSEGAAAPRPTRVQRARLLQVWRSAGWPFRDPLELDLLAAGWLEQRHSAEGHATVHLTPAGMAVLAQERQRHARPQSLHDRLALRMAAQLAQAGRLVWRELPLRAALDDTAPPEAAAQPPLWPGEAPAAEGAAPALPAAVRRVWRMARPDLFSLRRTSVEAYLRPMVHEVKATRADLLADLRHAAKRDAYAWLCEECYYAYPRGVAQPDEIPPALGIWEWVGPTDGPRLDDGHWALVRPARARPMRLPFALWMALAAAPPWRDPDMPAQAPLGMTAADDQDDQDDQDDGVG